MIVTLVMWDISVSDFFFAKARALVVYDITQRHSFEKAKRSWLMSSLNGPGQVPL